MDRAGDAAREARVDGLVVEAVEQGLDAGLGFDGVDAGALADGLRAHGHRMVRAVGDLDELCRELRDLAAEGDMVICMGAGDITKWAGALATGICDARSRK